MRFPGLDPSLFPPARGTQPAAKAKTRLRFEFRSFDKSVRKY
jgi:hypothetical protein